MEWHFYMSWTLMCIAAAVIQHRLDRIESKVDRLLRDQSPPLAPGEIPPEVLAALDRGETIVAIRILREANPSLGLREAKEADDEWIRRRRAD